MQTFLAIAAALAMGVEFGVQPIAGGGHEYIVQLDSNDVVELQRGQDFLSNVPANLTDIQRVRITFGTGELPQIIRPSANSNTAPQVEFNDSQQRGAFNSEGGVRPGPTSAFDDDAANQNRTNQPYRPLEGVSRFGEEYRLDQVPPPANQPAQTPEPNETRVNVSPPVSTQSGLNFSSGPPRNPERYPVDEPSDVPSTGPAIPGVDQANAVQPPASTPSPNVINTPQETAGVVDVEDEVESRETKKPAIDPSEVEEEVSLTAWSATVLALIASVGANVYLGWMWLNLRSRYRALLGTAEHHAMA